MGSEMCIRDRYSTVIQQQNNMTAVGLLCEPNKIRRIFIERFSHGPLVAKQRSAIMRLGPCDNQPCNNTLLSVCSPRVHHVYNGIAGAGAWLICDGSSGMVALNTVTLSDRNAKSDARPHGRAAIQLAALTGIG